MDVVDDIKKGKLIVVVCEPLAEAHMNLKWCPNREECDALFDYISGTYDCSELVESMQCFFCESKDWLIVGVTTKGTLVTMITTPEYGAKVREVLSNGSVQTSETQKGRERDVRG